MLDKFVVQRLLRETWTTRKLKPEAAWHQLGSSFMFSHELLQHHAKAAYIRFIKELIAAVLMNSQSTKILILYRHDCGGKHCSF
jgi:hypothetical protein